MPEHSGLSRGVGRFGVERYEPRYGRGQRVAKT